MFDTLTDRLSSVFRGLRGRGKITEDNVSEVMTEIRTALLEADVDRDGDVDDDDLDALRDNFSGPTQP